MGRNAEANEEQRAKARQALVDAAMRLFAEHGVEQVPIARVAAAAGLSKGLVYHYFASKAELVEAVLAKRLADVAAVMGEVPADLPAAARLRAFADAMVEQVRADPAGYRLLLRALTHPEGGEAIRAAVHARRDAYEERAAAFAATFAGLGAADPALEARFFQAALVGILTLQATSPMATEPGPLVARLFKAIDAGGES